MKRSHRAVIRSYLAGETLEASGALHGLTFGQVRYILARNGIPRRRKGPPSGPADPERLQTLRQLREQGWTYALIAERFGVTRQAIHGMLNYHEEGP